MPNIGYGCDSCADQAPEQMYYPEPSDLRVAPTGEWLCDDCWIEIRPYPNDDGEWRDNEGRLWSEWHNAPKVPRYVPESDPDDDPASNNPKSP